MSRHLFISIQGSGPGCATSPVWTALKRRRYAACRATRCRGFGIGFLAERLARPRHSHGARLRCRHVAFMLIQAVIVIQPGADYLRWFGYLFGFFGTSGIIQYASLSQHFSEPIPPVSQNNTATPAGVHQHIFCNG